jgi:hypothetical protein
MYEKHKDGWHHAAIVGNTKMSRLFVFSPVEAALLKEWNIVVVSKLFGTNELTGMLDRTDSE